MSCFFKVPLVFGRKSDISAPTCTLGWAGCADVGKRLMQGRSMHGRF